MLNFKKNAGFTLIELMAVILIIVILATLGIVAYSEATQSARDGKRRADIEAIRQAFILNRQDTGNYGSGNFAARLNTLVTNQFLSAPVPADPLPGNPAYSGSTTPAPYCICADLENATGNSTNASCNFTTSTGGFYCAQLQ